MFTWLLQSNTHDPTKRLDWKPDPGIELCSAIRPYAPDLNGV